MLRPCLDIPRWCERARRRAAVRARSTSSWRRPSAAAAPFTAEEVDGGARAPSAHRRARRPVARAEASMSRAEQAGVDPGDAAVAAALADGNRAYEERFGRVFLIRAAGRIGDARSSPRSRERLGHTDAEEEPVVAEQLRQIALLRLKGLMERMSISHITTHVLDADARPARRRASRSSCSRATATAGIAIAACRHRRRRSGLAARTRRAAAGGVPAAVRHRRVLRRARHRHVLPRGRAHRARRRRRTARARAAAAEPVRLFHLSRELSHDRARHRPRRRTSTARPRCAS